MVAVFHVTAAHRPKPVIVRTSDFKTNEYANLISIARGPCGILVLGASTRFSESGITPQNHGNPNFNLIKQKILARLSKQWTIEILNDRLSIFRGCRKMCSIPICYLIK